MAFDVEGNDAFFNNLVVPGTVIAPNIPPAPANAVVQVSASASVSDSTLFQIVNFPTTAQPPSNIVPTNTGVRFTVAENYQVMASVSWQSGSGSSGVREIQIKQFSGAVLLASQVLPAVVGGSDGNITRNTTSVFVMRTFNPGDSIEVWVYQDSGSINIAQTTLYVWQ